MSESIQKKLLRVRPPRIKITYDIETEGSSTTKELPVVLGMIGDYSGMRNPDVEFPLYKDRKFIYVDPDNFDEVFKSLSPRCTISVPSMDGKTTQAIELLFETLEDFKPLNLIKKVDFLYALETEKRQLTDLRMKCDISNKVDEFLNRIMTDSAFKDTIKAQATAGTGQDIDNMIQDTHFCHTDDQKPYAYQLILNFINVLEKNTDTNITEYVPLILSYITIVDTTISYYLNAILHDSNFQKLEGSWRGVLYVLQNAEFTGNLRLRLFNATSKELFDDLTKVMEFDQSTLFKKVYEEEYGTFGGNPYTAVMWDYSIGRSSEDMILLRKVTEVMAAAHCPLFVGAAPSLFDLKNFETLHQPYAITKIFDSVELAEYRSFRESPDAKYITLLLPRVMARLPYNTNEISIEGLNFVESVSGLSSNEYTWMSPAYVYLVQVAEAYARYGWLASICGVENGGKVDNLPLHLYKSPNGEWIAKCPTEVAITDRRERELSDLGFIALCNSKDDNFSVFFGSNSAFKPSLYVTENANANASLSARTPYMLNVSRFAHYLKCIMRDKIGAFYNAGEISNFLSAWLASYTLLDDKASRSLKAKYPLREFSLKVEEIPGKPGNYTSVLLIRPHDELQGIEISLRLVAQMPK